MAKGLAEVAAAVEADDLPMVRIEGRDTRRGAAPEKFPRADITVPFADDLRADLRAWLIAVSAGLADADGVAVARPLVVVTASDPAQGPELLGGSISRGRTDRDGTHDRWNRTVRLSGGRDSA
ncbi:hypothetical protein [Microbacterium foliorum]|uniref:hypothetical protein n=1 Tax=Microbacterium foliorum TaxID=104336 RepID=UPI001D28C4DE|nr:hypothetical protein [Microbacterium foliorum]CAH0237763.1 hypothetical protein SRABI03_02884 [Microbacterium foliorum]CAH0250203.1 hypothetical protein SRABI44_03137 [Microbacterium foliorum]